MTKVDGGDNVDLRNYRVKDFSPTGAARTVSLDLARIYRQDNLITKIQLSYNKMILQGSVVCPRRTHQGYYKTNPEV